MVFNRQELFEKVWTTPMTKLAKEYGINVYQLSKVCEILNIPRPETGYWSLIKHGKDTKPKPTLTEHHLDQ